MTTATLEDKLRTRAFELGFGQVRITCATLPGQVGARLDQSVADGFHGSMDWLAETAPRRRSPDAMWTGARSAITLAILTQDARDRLFGGLGMAWLLSRWRLPVAALVLGAVVWLLFPRIVAWGVHGHGTKLGAAMYLPWLVGWALRVLDGRSWRAVGMTGLLLGLQLLRVHVQITSEFDRVSVTIETFSRSASAWLCLAASAIPGL